MSKRTMSLEMFDRRTREIHRILEEDFFFADGRIKHAYNFMRLKIVAYQDKIQQCGNAITDSCGGADEELVSDMFCAFDVATFSVMTYDLFSPILVLLMLDEEMSIEEAKDAICDNIKMQDVDGYTELMEKYGDAAEKFAEEYKCNLAGPVNASFTATASAFTYAMHDTLFHGDIDSTRKGQQKAILHSLFDAIQQAGYEIKKIAGNSKLDDQTTASLLEQLMKSFGK